MVANPRGLSMGGAVGSNSNCSSRQPPEGLRCALTNTLKGLVLSSAPTFGRFSDSSEDPFLLKKCDISK